MTYEQAQKKSLEQPWRIDTCQAGEKCWCRTIRLTSPIPYLDHDGDEAMMEYVVMSGSIDTHVAQHIVNIHNDTLQASI